MAKCSICGKPAIAYVPYQRRYYCAEHFADHVLSKVRRTLRKYRLVGGGDRVLAAVSGGKDSAVLLDVLARLKREFGYQLAALHIDLGIGEYSVESRRAVESLVRDLGVPLIVFPVKEALGYSIPEMAMRLRRPACSVCGMVKRYIYNAFGVEGRAKVATGHNADDIMSFALKGFITQDLSSIPKLAPRTPGIEGLAAERIRPLYSVYEKESYLYALVRGLPHYHQECPHARLTSLEFRIKEMINRLEEERPGLKLGFLSKHAKNANQYPRERWEPSPCSSCGLLSSGGECSFCRTTRRLRGEPLGRSVREYARAQLERLGWM
ncbi:MAG: adenine nucleotide alpha hydrolase family protein [Desulfurococcales archaeon]|nr:adenine nucleotide alpha hydrolase family protein [Desulfurococcales archaeon]